MREEDVGGKRDRDAYCTIIDTSGRENREIEVRTKARPVLSSSPLTQSLGNQPGR